jgi:polysaccharide export outer membrane protein
MLKPFIRFIAFLLAPLMFFGCASPGVKVADAPAENEYKEVKPMISEFILGVGDSLDITIYRNDDLKTSTKINPSGKIMFPLIGEVQAAGRSTTALREDLRERYSNYLVDPQISISISAIQSQKFLVLGEIKSPGVFNLDSDYTILDAVAKAGGWNQDAKTSNVLLLRNVGGKVEARSIDMDEVMKGGNVAYNKQLQRNDIVFVPTKKIANIARYASYLSSILSPVVLTESGIVLWPQALDVLEGKKASTQITIPAR